MPFEIFDSTEFSHEQVYCSGSFTKPLTTFVSLSLLAEKYDLNQILDDENFLDEIAVNPEAKSFLQLFQKIIGSKFTLRDLCSYYTGLPYTFNPTESALENADAGKPFKHHSILDEKEFLYICENKIAPIYNNRSKFHYSEISIIFLGYLMEKIYGTTMEDLYKKYLTDKFNLPNSQLARTRPENVFVQDMSDRYDYPAVAIQQHGYFCYSNGFYTTLNDSKKLLEGLVTDPVFQYMIDIKKARSAGETLMNGLSLELKTVGDDLIFGYDGMSFSGVNAWAYSTKLKQGYITFCNNPDPAYEYIYAKFGYSDFDKVPDYTEHNYTRFLQNYQYPMTSIDIPNVYQGNYQRVLMNGVELKDVFELGNNYMVIRNPDVIKYDLMYVNEGYHVKGDDNTQEARVELYQAQSSNRYMFYAGNLYKRIEAVEINEEEISKGNVPK